MEMRQLRYFVRVAELRNFTRAAESCNVSQPSLSQQIGKLERELGHALFERNGRKVIMTASGEILYEHAIKILAHAEEAEIQIREAAEAGKGRITVAAIPTVAPFLLPPVLTLFRQEFPHATVEVVELVTAESVKGCLENEIDLILLARPFEEEGLRVEELFTEELLVVLPPDHKLAKQPVLTVDDLQTEQFVLLDDAHCLSDNIINFCEKRSVHPSISCRGSQLQTIQEIVSIGQGISLIPEMARRVDQSESRVYRSLASDPAFRQIVMAWNKNRFQSQLAKSLAQVIRKTIKKENQ